MRSENRPKRFLFSNANAEEIARELRELADRLAEEGRDPDDLRLLHDAADLLPISKLAWGYTIENQNIIHNARRAAVASSKDIAVDEVFSILGIIKKTDTVREQLLEWWWQVTIPGGGYDPEHPFVRDLLWLYPEHHAGEPGLEYIYVKPGTEKREFLDRFAEILGVSRRTVANKINEQRKKTPHDHMCADAPWADPA